MLEQLQRFLRDNDAARADAGAAPSSDDDDGDEPATTPD
jgi:hypothetical protein